MKKHKLLNQDGTEIAVIPLGEFKGATIAYRYDTQYREYLNHLWAKGATPEEAIATLRQELGARTKAEKLAARSAKDKSSAPRGRPVQELGLQEAKSAIAGAMFLTLAKLERRRMSPEARTLVDGIRKQLATW